MRNGLHVSLVAASLLVGSCGDDDNPSMTPPPPGEDGAVPTPTPPTPQPPPPPGGDAGVIVPTPPPGMEATVDIVMPEFELGPYEENTLCYYTTVRVDGELGIRGWESSMTAGSHHLIMFFTRSASRPDGTLEECGLTGIAGDLTGGVPIWAYAAQEPEASIQYPPGVGFPFTTEQHLFVQMHYLNATGETIRPNVRITGRSYPQGQEYIRAGVFATFSTEIEVPPGETGSAGGNCEVTGDENFFMLSTHSHQFTTSARVFDGDNMLVDTDDWEHPAVQQWNAEPFYRFTSGRLRYECEYQNPTRSTIRTGDSAETDEMCMAVGYFFPSRGMRFCFNDRVISL